MAVTLNASTSSGFIQTADTSGQLQLQANGTTVLTVNPANFTQGNIALGTAAAGAHEYNGYSPYFTPFGTSRGVLPAYQYYELNTAFAGANVATAQSIFGLTNGFTLGASTIYEFEACFVLSKSAGATSHLIGLGFGGTATVNNILYQTMGSYILSATPSGPNAFALIGSVANSTANTATMSVTTQVAVSFMFIMKGTVSINAAGTFIPQYTLSAAPGGAYTTQIGSYFKISPLAASGANVSIGNVS
jgi:hypothetical protein